MLQNSRCPTMSASGSRRCAAAEQRFVGGRVHRTGGIADQVVLGEAEGMREEEARLQARIVGDRPAAAP